MMVYCNWYKLLSKLQIDKWSTNQSQTCYSPNMTNHKPALTYDQLTNHKPAIAPRHEPKLFEAPQQYLGLYRAPEPKMFENCHWCRCYCQLYMLWQHKYQIQFKGMCNMAIFPVLIHLILCYVLIQWFYNKGDQ